jgi:endoglucanase
MDHAGRRRRSAAGVGCTAALTLLAMVAAVAAPAGAAPAGAAPAATAPAGAAPAGAAPAATAPAGAAPAGAAAAGASSATPIEPAAAGVMPSTPRAPAAAPRRPAAGEPSTTSLDGISVQGNRLVDGAGHTVQLHGVNRSGTEYACVQGWGIFDGPSDAASVAAIASWHADIVRIPLNEDCWLGINGVAASYSGANYRNAVVAYVNLLHRYGMYAELSLIWAAPGTYQATYQPDAPDEDHSPAMWASLAATFKHDPDVVLAPWGETTTGWTCFMKTGCDNQATYGPSNQPYQTASMQQAVNVMRGAGYRGVISVPCIDYANMCGTLPDGSDYDGSTWLQSRPSDPDHQLIAEAHVYGKNLCDTVACLDSSMAPIARSVPLVFGETGETYDASDCGPSYVTTFIDWADTHGVGYEAWTWDTWGGCGVLIGGYSGTPASAWATWVRDHYLQRWPGGGGGPPPTGPGYWLAQGSGEVDPFAAAALGSMAGGTLAAPVVGIAPQGTAGYWLAGRDGGVFAFGSARFHGSAGALRLHAPVVGIAATCDRKGYWLVASDGGVFSYGDARFHGSTGGLRLRAPIVGIVAAPGCGGYWMVAADGGVFRFGSARYAGSGARLSPGSPFVGMAAAPGGGYWLATAAGGVFSFGGARFHGSAAPGRPAAPVVAIVATSDGFGYWLVTSDGGVYSFGDAHFRGRDHLAPGSVAGAAAA